VSVACRVCGGNAVAPFLDIEGAPVFCNQLCQSREEALAAPSARIRLGHCADCDHIFNLDFEPDRLAYSPEYENSLHFSGRFQSYADALADALVERYGLREKTIIEIGCGRGDFLASLCARGTNRGYGFDPGFPGESGREDPERQITIYREPYAARHGRFPADLICCRHALEHVDEPMPFLAMLRNAIGDARETAIFFEVPNALYTLRDGGIWDLIYEHCGYFSPMSLGRAFEAAGFDVLDIEESFAGQFLTLHARVGEGAHPASPWNGLGRAADHLATFASVYRDKVAQWRRRLDEIARADRTVVVWGAGSKGTTFLNTVDGARSIEHVVDINPRKHGKFVAGTGQEIVPPERLTGLRPAVVIVMNPIYRDEIGATVAGLGLEAELLEA
jgi:hypothetical protein